MPFARVQTRDQPVSFVFIRLKEFSMNKDQVGGRAQNAKGKVKEAAGKMLGKDRLKAEGKADQVSGKSKAAYGDVKQKVKDVIDKA
jgi:uncharacterized protein YjbJ (UPF0337 family)